MAMEKEKIVDESWKESVLKEKEIHKGGSNTQKSDKAKLFVQEPFAKDQPEDTSTEQRSSPRSSSAEEGVSPSASGDSPPINFLNYLTSLGFQAMIFLGEIPHPMTNQIERNLEQAKFIIDTLIMLREKTKGNLTKQEEDMLNASIYELQMKYVELLQQEAAGGPGAHNSSKKGQR